MSDAQETPAESRPVVSRRASRWEQQRSDWYKDAARTEISSQTAYLLWGFGLSALALVGVGSSWLPDLKGFVALAAALACALTIHGLRGGRAWSRWVGGVVALALFAVQVYALVLGALLEEGPSLPQWIFGALVGLMWGSISLFLLRPGASELFRQAREGAPEGGSAD